MRAPNPPGTAINANRYDVWLNDFSTYAYQVTRGSIESWLAQFDDPDKDIAARLLDCVFYSGSDQIRATYRTLLNAIPGWHRDPAQRVGRWFFVPYSGSAGESGDRMTHEFRLANDMSRKQYSQLFIHKSELVRAEPGPDDTVVLIDDFSATGTQACDAWEAVFAELLPQQPRIFLMLVATTADARERIERETEMAVSAGVVLDHSDEVFHDACLHFPAAEKERIRHYCNRASATKPQGFGGKGLLVVFNHRCPNNSLPILYARHGDWRGLFLR